MCIWQWRVSAAHSTVFKNLFAKYKTTKSHENYVFLYPFFSVAIFARNNDFLKFYTSKLDGLTGMNNFSYLQFQFLVISLLVVIILLRTQS